MVPVYVMLNCLFTSLSSPFSPVTRGLVLTLSWTCKMSTQNMCQALSASFCCLLLSHLANLSPFVLASMIFLVAKFCF